MNVLYIGGVIPKELIKTITDDTFNKFGFSNHNFEMSLIKGFSLQPNINLRIISLPKVFSFPHNNKKIYIKSEKYSYNRIPFRSIGFFNLTLINLFSRTFFLYMGIKQELKN